MCYTHSAFKHIHREYVAAQKKGQIYCMHSTLPTGLKCKDTILNLGLKRVYKKKFEKAVLGYFRTLQRVLRNQHTVHFDLFKLVQ